MCPGFGQNLRLRTVVGSDSVSRFQQPEIHELLSFRFTHMGGASYWWTGSVLPDCDKPSLPCSDIRI
jgi:hypothetical protein